MVIKIPRNQHSNSRSLWLLGLGISGGPPAISYRANSKQSWDSDLGCLISPGSVFFSRQSYTASTYWVLAAWKPAHTRLDSFQILENTREPVGR